MDGSAATGAADVSDCVDGGATLERRLSSESSTGLPSTQGALSDSLIAQGTASGNRGSSRRRRRTAKGGQKHRRQPWKPYDRLTVEEKRQRGEREERVAERKRQDALLSGHPAAPFNTTQFIMDEHDGSRQVTPRLATTSSSGGQGKSGTPSEELPRSNVGIGGGRTGGGGSGSGNFGSNSQTPIREGEGGAGPVDDSYNNYLEREFNAALESIRNERLQSMTVDQLRAEVLRLEKAMSDERNQYKRQLALKDVQLSGLRNELATVRSQHNGGSTSNVTAQHQ